jgi:hypothetical protein
MLLIIEIMPYLVFIVILLFLVVVYDGYSWISVSIPFDTRLPL